MATDATSQPTLEDARRVAASFRASLPKMVDAASLTLKSKTPFKVLVLRESLIHRVVSLTDGAISELSASRWVSGTILIRAVTETAAVLHSLDLQVRRALQDGNDDTLTEFLRRTMVSSRSEPDLPESLNILTLIDKVDKDFPRFRRSYDELSEYAHPNWCGVLGAFSELDEKTHTVAFGEFDRPPAQSAPAALLAVLVVAEHVYNNCAEHAEELNTAFDTGVIAYAT